MLPGAQTMLAMGMAHLAEYTAEAASLAGQFRSWSSFGRRVEKGRTRFRPTAAARFWPGSTLTAIERDADLEYAGTDSFEERLRQTCGGRVG